MNQSFRLLGVCVLAMLAGCTSLTLRPVDYSWPVESVLRVEGKGMVQESRYLVTFNIKPLLFEETGDSSIAGSITVRMIRDQEGYYFITAPRFKYVYVFASGEGSLKLENRILISEQGMDSPAFNARSPYIQLLNGNEKPLMLSSGGIQQGGKE